ncbi:MAG: OmpA family protein [Thermodesulfobacteriota bacterium]
MSRRTRRKQAAEKEPNLERWLISYADFITLLFAVFVTLYAMSVVDNAKVEAVKSSIQSSFGVTQEGPVFSVIDSPALDKVVVVPERPPEAGGSARGAFAGAEEFGRIQGQLVSQLAQEKDQGAVDVAVTERGLVVSLKEGGVFASGSATLQPQAIPRLNEVAKALGGYANAIRVEGHTDNVPVASGGFASNWELSSARANAVVQFLISKRGIPGAKLSATGYGEYRPVADNSTEDGRRRNRRVDIVLLSSQGSMGEPGAGQRPR